MSSIKVAKDNKVYDSREDCNAIIKTETNELIQGSSKIKIPNSVTSIVNRAFYGVTSLSNIEIPSNVISINDLAFGDCSNLNSIKISEGVKTMHIRAFNGCSSLNSIEIPASIINIDSGGIGIGNIPDISENCDNLTKITNKSIVPIYFFGGG